MANEIFIVINQGESAFASYEDLNSKLDLCLQDAFLIAENDQEALQIAGSVCKHRSSSLCLYKRYPGEETIDCGDMSEMVAEDQIPSGQDYNGLIDYIVTEFKASAILFLRPEAYERLDYYLMAQVNRSENVAIFLYDHLKRTELFTLIDQANNCGDMSQSLEKLKNVKNNTKALYKKAKGIQKTFEKEFKSNSAEISRQLYQKIDQMITGIEKNLTTIDERTEEYFGSQSVPENALAIKRFSYEEDDETWLIKIRNKTDLNISNVDLWLDEDKQVLANFRFIEGRATVYRHINMGTEYDPSFYDKSLGLFHNQMQVSPAFPIRPILITRLKEVQPSKISITILNKSNRSFYNYTVVSPSLMKTYKFPEKETNLRYDDSKTIIVKLNVEIHDIQFFILANNSGNHKEVVSNGKKVKLSRDERTPDDSSSMNDVRSTSEATHLNFQ